MLSAMLGQVEERLTALIVEKSEGVPFFLEELVQSLQETGAIERHEAAGGSSLGQRRCRSRTRSKKSS